MFFFFQHFTSQLMERKETGSFYGKTDSNSTSIWYLYVRRKTQIIRNTEEKNMIQVKMLSSKLYKRNNNAFGFNWYLLIPFDV